MIRKYADIFCWKNVSSFCSATHIFSAKNIRILCIESAKTANEMTLNELVKLTSFEQLGPDWEDTQADLDLRWAHVSEGTFSHVAAHFSDDKITILHNLFITLVLGSIA